MTAVTSLETQQKTAAGAGSIPRYIKLTWGSGALGVAILMNAVGFLALFYMVGVLKLDPALAGALIFITKLFDVVSDPVVGSWSDRLKSSKSRRRPFLLAGALISSGAFVMIFTTPIFESQFVTAAYVFTALIIYTLGYTIFNVPYMSMPAEMTDDYHERSSIHGYRVVFVSLGGLATFSLAPLLLEMLGRTTWTAYAVVGAGGGAVILVSMLTAWAGTSEARFTQTAAKRPKILSELRHVFSNGHFIRLLLVKAAQLLGVAASKAAMIFFILNTLQLDLIAQTYYGLVLGVGAIVATPFLVRLSHRIGKKNAYIVAALCNVAAAGSWALASPGEPIWAILLRAAFVSIAMSGSIVMAMSMLTDIINLDSQRSGVRREGVFTAFYSFTEKFTFAFGPLIVGLALAAAGFNQDLPPDQLQTPQIRQALLLGVAYIPAALGLASILLLWGYRLQRKDVDSTRSAPSS